MEKNIWDIVLGNLASGCDQVKRECGSILRNFTFCGATNVIHEFYSKNRGVSKFFFNFLGDKSDF